MIDNLGHESNKSKCLDLKDVNNKNERIHIKRKIEAWSSMEVPSGSGGLSFSSALTCSGRKLAEYVLRTSVVWRGP